jgi:hypothetical protein
MIIILQGFLLFAYARLPFFNRSYFPQPKLFFLRQFRFFLFWNSQLSGADNLPLIRLCKDVITLLDVAAFFLAWDYVRFVYATARMSHM